jgi:hypothetical protein
MIGTKLTLENICKVDAGKVEAMVNRAIAQVVDDMQQRPGDESQRRVVLTMAFKPESSEEGVLDNVATEFTVSVSVPPRRSRPYPMEPHAGSRSLLFNPASPTNPRQHTLDEGGD